METEEERLVLKLRSLCDAEDQDSEKWKEAKVKGLQVSRTRMHLLEQIAVVRKWASKTHTSYSRIFGSDEAMEVLPRLLRLGPHIRYAPWMKVSTLGDLFGGTHGGVS
jgi:hypothetical protein